MVVINIPLSLLGAVTALWVTHQTVNIMTLGGLALAVGILVDMSTVVVENIHTHLERGRPIARAVVDSGGEVALPLLISMLCVLAVFVPSFFMVGAARALFVPLSLASNLLPSTPGVGSRPAGPPAPLLPGEKAQSGQATRASPVCNDAMPGLSGRRCACAGRSCHFIWPWRPW